MEISLTINNKKISVEEGTTILEAAKENNILIPNLCHLENVHSLGSCRMCVVEVEGSKNLVASCITSVREGMVVRTNTKRVKNAVRVIYELLMSDHPRNCLNCVRNQNCEFQKLGEIIQIDECRFEGEKSKNYIDDTSPAIVRYAAKCISCRRCVTVCNEIQGVGILNIQNRGFNSVVAPAAEQSFNNV
ncbi:MAG: 2Fe-2S iron-sulfur cluster-binding protein, partial [Brevinematia bacterium]